VFLQATPIQLENMTPSPVGEALNLVRDDIDKLRH
jgi:hypothetical protein